MASSKTPQAPARRPAARDFKDSGLERSFKKGEVPDVDDGTYENYVAAGVVAAPEPEEPSAVPAGKAD